MFNARNKLFALTATALLLSACSSKNDQLQVAADTLYTQAEEALTSGNHNLAIELLDSLDYNYKTVTEVIKKSIVLRPKAVIKQSENEIAMIDSILAAKTARIEVVAPMMKHIDIPGTDGYYVPSKGYSSKFMSTTGVSPRVDDIGQFYIVSSVNPAGNLRHTSLTFISKDSDVTTSQVSEGSDSNFRIQGSEVVTFSPAMSDTVAQFFRALPEGSKVTVRFNGQRGSTKSATVNTMAFLTAIEYSDLINEMRRLTIERQRYQARIDTANRQLSASQSSKSAQE